MTTIVTAQSATAKPRRASPATDRQPKAVPGIKGAPTKADIVAKLLTRPKGATVTEVTGATGWQAHSVRAFFSGLRKKGSVLEREPRKDGTSSYRLITPAAKPTTPSIATAVSASNEGRVGAAGGEA